MRKAILKGSVLAIVIAIGALAGLVASGKNVSSPEIVFEPKHSEK